MLCTQVLFLGQNDIINVVFPKEKKMSLEEATRLINYLAKIYDSLNYFGFSKLTNKDKTAWNRVNTGYQLILLAWGQRTAQTPGARPLLHPAVRAGCYSTRMLQHHVPPSPWGPATTFPWRKSAAVSFRMFPPLGACHSPWFWKTTLLVQRGIGVDPNRLRETFPQAQAT